jgi:hypothetical protein
MEEKLDWAGGTDGKQIHSQTELKGSIERLSRSRKKLVKASWLVFE